MSLRRGITAGAVAVAAVAGLVTAGAAPAAAGTVTVTYTCVPVGIPAYRDTFDITITAPATAARGQTVTVHTTVAQTEPSTVHIAADTYQGAIAIKLGGAGTGSAGVSIVNPDIAVGTPLRMSGSTQVTLSTAGTVTYRPGGLSFTRPYRIGCGPTDPASVPVAATTQVS